MLQSYVLLPTEEKCKQYKISKEDIVNQFYKDTYTVDYAIPMQWADSMSIEHNIPRSEFNFVWGYPKNEDSPYRLFGLPLPMSIKAANYLYRIDPKMYFSITKQ